MTDELNALCRLCRGRKECLSDVGQGVMNECIEFQEGSCHYFVPTHLTLWQLTKITARLGLLALAVAATIVVLFHFVSAFFPEWY